MFQDMIMQHDGSINNSKTSVLQTSIQIRCPFMHHHIVHVNNLGVKVLTIEIYLTLLDWRNKITYKTQPRLGKFN
jgi:hypothetical protein